MNRTTVRLPKELDEFYKSEAEKLGISFNALLIVVLNQYKKDQEVERRN